LLGREWPSIVFVAQLALQESVYYRSYAFERLVTIGWIEVGAWLAEVAVDWFLGLVNDALDLIPPVEQQRVQPQCAVATPGQSARKALAGRQS
jgi:hypothetical protein